jgi:hypothetical protein
MQQLRAIEDAYTTALRNAVTVLARQQATVQGIAAATRNLHRPCQAGAGNQQ